MRASEVNFKIAKILKMCKYQSLSFYVPLGAVLQISGGISHQRRKEEKEEGPPPEGRITTKIVHKKLIKYILFTPKYKMYSMFELIEVNLVNY